MNNDAETPRDVLGDYLSEQELASQLDVSLRTVRRWHSLREGPPRTTIGKAIYYRRDAVSDWLRSNEHAAA